MSYWYPLAVPTLGEEEIAAATAVLRSGFTTMGEKTEEFEEEFARRVGASYGVMVNSGSSADLLIALAFCEMGWWKKGETVLLSAVTWPTHVWSWVMAGFPVRFADVDPTTLNCTAEQIKSELAGVSVVSLVHLMGNPCDMAGIVDLLGDTRITEDCCEALGSSINNRPVGTSGEAASWSFFFSHHMTTMEGGMVTTNNRRMRDALRCLRSHGWARQLEKPPAGDPRYTFVTAGMNVRPTEVAAAIGLVQLERLDGMNQLRKVNFDEFAYGIADNPHIHLPKAVGEPSWFGLPLMVDEDAPFTRDDLAQMLELHGVETRPILAGNLLRQPVFKSWQQGSFPGADAVHDRGLYIGLHPTLNSDIDKIVGLIGMTW